jgi:hypothetical protein
MKKLFAVTLAIVFTAGVNASVKQFTHHADSSTVGIGPISMDPLPTCGPPPQYPCFAPVKK